MVQHYSPKTFLRQTSNAMLQACFNKHEALAGVAWNELAEHQIDVVYDGWQNLPEAQRLAIERVFEDAEELADEEGLRALIEEGQFHRLELATELKQCPNFRDKALHVWLNYPRVFEVAGTINRAHSLPQRYWLRRGGMPLKQPDVSPEGIERFRSTISAYFRQTQGRSPHCTVDPYLVFVAEGTFFNFARLWRLAF